MLVPDWTWKAVYVPATGEHEARVCSNVRDTVCDEEPIAAIAQRFAIRVFPMKTQAWAEKGPSAENGDFPAVEVQQPPKYEASGPDGRMTNVPRPFTLGVGCTATDALSPYSVASCFTHCFLA